jgi:hypothetical protein
MLPCLHPTFNYKGGHTEACCALLQNITRVDLEVLPQEMAPGEMLEAIVLGNPLAHSALARTHTGVWKP